VSGQLPAPSCGLKVKRKTSRLGAPVAQRLWCKQNPEFVEHARMRRIRILSRGILGDFAETVYANRNRVFRLWLISPWIGADDEGLDGLCLLIEALRGRKCDVIVVTREPKDAWHLKGVELIEKQINSTIFYCASLHSKLYIAECNGFRCAVLGSPNLTPRANTVNREIAVEFKTTTTTDDFEVALVINELTQYASSLRDEPDVMLK
jgi:phosphatidylserine/phosphatidylglycerophosphate/cardiolipin synthase-like enzyme